MFGYNSHGNYCELSHIYDCENERGNATASKIKEFYQTHGQCQAIWVCYDPIICFKMYCYDEEGNMIDMSLTKQEILKQYPDYINQICEIDLSGMTLVCSDEQGGYLYARLNTKLPNRSTAYRKHQRQRVIKRKKKITKENYQCENYYRYEGQYDKGKVHCSCWMCSRKTKNRGLSLSDKRKLDKSNYQED